MHCAIHLGLGAQSQTQMLRNCIQMQQYHVMRSQRCSQCVQWPFCRASIVPTNRGHKCAHLSIFVAVVVEQHRSIQTPFSVVSWPDNKVSFLESLSPVPLFVHPPYLDRILQLFQRCRLIGQQQARQDSKRSTMVTSQSREHRYMHTKARDVYEPL